MELQTGDIIFYSGKGIISKFIQWFTKSKISHVSVVLSTGKNDERQVFIAEAQWGGFVFTKTYKPWIEQNCGVGRVFEKMTATQRKQFRSSSIKLLGQKYDFMALVAIAKSIMGLAPKNDQNLQKVICSEAVELIYRDMGVVLVDDLPEYVTPADIYRSKKVKRIQSLPIS